MKNFILKNKITLLLIFTILILIIGIFSTSFGTETANNFNDSLGIVNTKHLNMRTGAGLSFDSIDILNKNEYVRIFGKIDDWYIIQNEDNLIGTVNEKYITKTDTQKVPVSNIEEINDLSADEAYLINLINKIRLQNNLVELKIDKELQNIARLKAVDLVENNYFSHNSPTYGSPFEMLKKFNITYKTASENIAGNSSLDSALESWLNSESHRNNILSNEYNYTGIGISNSIAYGKIIVQFFIGK